MADDEEELAADLGRLFEEYTPLRARTLHDETRDQRERQEGDQP